MALSTYTFQNLQAVIHDGDLSEHALYTASQRQYQLDVNCDTRCIVSLFGRLDDGNDICCHVTDFEPYFDICLGRRQNTDLLDDLLCYLKKKLGDKDFHDFIYFGAPEFKKSNHGFRNGEMECIVPLYCQNLFAYYRVGYHLRDIAKSGKYSDFGGLFRLVNKDVDPLLRFWGDLHIKKCKPCGWYTIPSRLVKICQPHRRQSTCDVEFSLSYGHFAGCAATKIDLNPHFINLCFDIETFTVDRKKDGIDPLVPGNVCICIGVTLFSESKGFFDRQCFYFPYQGEHADDEEWQEALRASFKSQNPSTSQNTHIHIFSTEKTMLEAFGSYVKAQRPDVILGYNSDAFDFWYIYERANVVQASGLFYNMSKIRREAPMFLTHSTFESPGRGTVTCQRPTIFGIFVMDVMIPIKDDVTKKYDSYRLKDVTQHILKDAAEKYDLPIEIMSQQYQENTAPEVAEIITYCMRDVEITQKIATIDILLNKLVEMSNLTVVEILNLIAKGQTIRCVSLLYANYTLPHFNYFIDDNHLPDDDLAGGHVVEPFVGLHKDPVITLDFKSLYPSIMMAYQLDFSSIVHEDKYLNLPNVEYFVSESTHPISGRRITATFATKKGIQHVIPTVLQELSTRRQEVKRSMKQYDEEHSTYKALNSVQNAIKVQMNSFYGFVGGQKFPIGAYAHAVTGQGRNLSGMCKRMIETSIPNHLAKILPRSPSIIYGDSVTADTPVLLQNADGSIMYRCIDDINPNEEWVDRIGDGKQYKNCPYKVWTDKGFVAVTNVIRHKTNKQLYRVRTPTGIADVTEDHSLLSPSGEKLKPTDVTIGTLLLHTDLPYPSANIKVDFDEEYAWAMGFFYADGSCGYYGSGYNAKATWALNKQDKSLLERAADALERHEGGLKFKILETLRSSGVYKLVAISNKVHGGIVKLVKKWRMWFYDDRQHKKVPDIVLNADFKTRLAFFKGYYAGDGLHDGTTNIGLDFTNKGKIGAAGLIHLINSLGYTYTFSPYKAKPHCFRIRAYTKHDGKGHLLDEVDALLQDIEHLTLQDGRKKLPWTRDMNGVIAVTELPQTTDYVYDLTTENGHFGVGPGRMIAHNTDSVFVLCPGATIEQADTFGYAVEKYLTSKFVPPIELEYEKMFIRCMLIKRKNYMYVMRDHCKVKYQGGEQVKRDYCRYFQEVYNIITNYLILQEISEEHAKELQTYKENNRDLANLLRQNVDTHRRMTNDIGHLDVSYVDFVKQEKAKATEILSILDNLSKKSSTQIEAERSQRIAYQPLPVHEALREINLATSLRYKQSYLAQNATADEEESTILLNGLLLLHMWINKLRDYKNINVEVLNQLTMSCRLNGRYHSLALSKEKDDKVKVSPYDKRDWVIPNNGPIHLARRIRQRSPGQEPSIGERFSYINILHFDRSDVKTEQLETVEFAVNNKLPLDLNAYLEKNGMPFQKLFAVAGVGYVCGIMLDTIMKEVTADVNRDIAIFMNMERESAKQTFFRPREHVVRQNTFQQRKDKLSNAAKGQQKLKEASNKKISEYFTKPK